MPLYEYQCVPNGHRFEVRQGITDEPVQSCPECGESVRRVIHPVGVVFKGSGFYVNDSRKSNPAGKPAESGSKDAAKGENKSAGGESARSGESKSGETKSGEKKSESSAST